ncbi:MAG: thioredoxin family protein [Chloroflexota bacterium]
MKIEILGTGCYKCVELEMLIADVLKELGKTDIEVTRVDDEQRIRHYMPLDEVPGLLIDGVLANMRELPPREKLLEWLSGVSTPQTQ